MKTGMVSRTLVAGERCGSWKVGNQLSRFSTEIQEEAVAVGIVSRDITLAPLNAFS